MGTRPMMVMMTLSHPRKRTMRKKQKNHLTSTVVPIEGALERKAQIRHLSHNIVSVQESP